MKKVTSFNQTGSISDWARWLGISECAMRERLKKYPVEEALTRPTRGGEGQKLYYYKGERKRLKSWAEELGLSYSTLCKKVNQGYTIEQVVNSVRKKKGIKHFNSLFIEEIPVELVGTLEDSFIQGLQDQHKLKNFKSSKFNHPIKSHVQQLEYEFYSTELLKDEALELCKQYPEINFTWSFHNYNKTEIGLVEQEDRIRRCSASLTQKGYETSTVRLINQVI